jgi:hypothetical protein
VRSTRRTAKRSDRANQPGQIAHPARLVDSV